MPLGSLTFTPSSYLKYYLGYILTKWGKSADFDIFLKRQKNIKLSEIKNAKPKEKDYLLSDGYNLYLLIKPNASKLWKFIYQSPETGKQLKLSLGKYPFKTLTEARSYYKLLTDGIMAFE